MAVFWVMTPAMKADGKSIGFPWLVFPGLESADQKHMDMLAKKLADDGIVSGTRLDTLPGPNNTRLIRSRVPCALSAKGIASILPPACPIVEST